MRRFIVSVIACVRRAAWPRDHDGAEHQRPGGVRDAWTGTSLSSPRPDRPRVDRAPPREPPAGPFHLGLLRFTNEPGSVFIGAADDPSGGLVLVESGVVTVRLEEPATITRATGPEEVAADTEFTLGPGESSSGSRSWLAKSATMGRKRPSRSGLPGPGGMGVRERRRWPAHQRRSAGPRPLIDCPAPLQPAPRRFVSEAARSIASLKGAAMESFRIATLTQPFRRRRLSRRAALASAGASLSTTLLGRLGLSPRGAMAQDATPAAATATGDNLPPHVPAWMQTPGAPSSPYGERAPAEESVVRLAPNPVVSFSPLAELHGHAHAQCPLLRDPLRGHPGHRPERAPVARPWSGRAPHALHDG